MTSEHDLINFQSFAKILWVENDEMHMQEYIDALRDQGATVLIASNITHAIQVINEHPEISLVILDVMLPISSQEQEQFSLGATGGSKAGIALGRWIREHYPKMKIIGCSVAIDKKIAEWFEEYGAGFALKQSFADKKDFMKFIRRTIMKEERIKHLKTFIVHGHDDTEKLALKNYLQNTLGLPEPIILHEKPSIGRTIIEKFEEISDEIDVVFVLLTPDDPIPTGSPGSVIKYHARQNVIFELGYFIAKLRRRNGQVILLYKGVLELPSDLSGLIYINIDAGIEAVSEQIRRELQAL